MGLDPRWPFLDPPPPAPGRWGSRLCLARGEEGPAPGAPSRLCGALSDPAEQAPGPDAQAQEPLGGLSRWAELSRPQRTKASQQL